MQAPGQGERHERSHGIGAFKPVVSTMAVAAALATLPVMAQDAGPPEGATPVFAEDASPEETAIIVTESRIARDTFLTATPVAMVSAEAIEAQAATDIADVPNNLPSFRPQATPATTAIFIGNAGGNLADVRGLGAQRTLVLVDGRRFVPGTVLGSGNAPAFTVDLNMIPRR